MYYLPKHFKVEELVPPDLFTIHGYDSLYFLDDRITKTLDMLRERLDASIMVNNWNMGGVITQRGYRTSQTVGASYSAHRFGRAVDFDIKNLSAGQFRNMVRSVGVQTFSETSLLDETSLQYITRIEDDVAWNHIDCMGLPREPGEKIIFFKP